MSIPPAIAASLLTVLISVPTHNSSWTRKHLIIWNVGQGQWATITTATRCLHFDSGGEAMPPTNLLLEICRQKENQHFLSHYDWDHMSFLRKFSRLFPRFCRSEAPHDPKRWHRQHDYSKWPRCSDESFVGRLFPMKNHFESKGFQPNDSSFVHFAFNVLFPGDSTKKSEKIWVNSEHLQQADILLLGHHGSDTSTSWRLLNRMSRLRMAIASCRRARYGHPHWNVRKRIRRKKTPLLITEAWNHIFIELD